MGLFRKRKGRATRKAEAKALKHKATLEAKLGAKNERSPPVRTHATCGGDLAAVTASLSWSVSMPSTLPLVLQRSCWSLRLGACVTLQSKACAEVQNFCRSRPDRPSSRVLLSVPQHGTERSASEVAGSRHPQVTRALALKRTLGNAKNAHSIVANIYATVCHEAMVALRDATSDIEQPSVAYSGHFLCGAGRVGRPAVSLPRTCASFNTCTIVS